MQNNHDQSKNVNNFYFLLRINIIKLLKSFIFQLQGRDLSIAYLLVTLTYIIVGVVFYVCFPLNKSCIEDVSKILN